tara:strand:+ start:30 stop:1628 length:1599 start_codon:yes stop_codon:yes gene_type:complete
MNNKYNVILKSKYNEKDTNIDLKDLIKKRKYLDTSYVNAIRRYAINNINTLAFEYYPIPKNINYINIIENNSSMNNDFIGHRIGLLPVHIASIKYLLFIYKIISGNQNYFDNLLKKLSKEKKLQPYLIYKEIKNNLKLSDENNIKFIQNIIFYIDIFNTTDIIDITTLDILIKFSDISNDIDYTSKLNKYSELFKIYEKYTQIKINNISNFKSELLLKIFKPFIIQDKEYGVLLCKLKKNEKLKCEFKLNLGCAEQHSRWSVVSPISYSFVIDYNRVKEILLERLKDKKLLNTDLSDELKTNVNITTFIDNRYNDIINFNMNDDNINSLKTFITTLNDDEVNLFKKFINNKDNLLNIFNKCDNQRYFYGKEEQEIYKRQFNLTIESIGFYDAERILHKANKLLIKDLLNLFSNIINLLTDFNMFPLKKNDLIIDKSQKIINGLDIFYTNGSHSIGNILQSYIYYYCDNSIITYIGYKLIHPLKKDMLLTIGFDLEFNNIESYTTTLFNELTSIFSEMNIVNFQLEQDEDDED